MARLAPTLCLLASVAAVTGCGRPFDVKTSPGLVELDNQGPTYAYRAIAPEGVVMAIRVVDTKGRGDLEFWTRATSLRIHQLDGYALLGRADVQSRDGTPGKELDFGHDENGKPYLYSLRVFVRDSRLYLVETGGPKDEVERYKQALTWMQASLKLD
jgi:hypothetical protein